MITRVLTVVWLLIPTFTILHAVPTEVKTNKETQNEEVPISNEKMKLTEKESKSISGLTAIEELEKFSPASLDDKKDGGKVHKNFGECEDIAEKQLDVPWSTKKKCLKILWAEAKKEQKSLKVFTYWELLILHFKDGITI